MQGSVFIYTAGGLAVSSFTGTGTEFNNVAAGLAKVWQMVQDYLSGSEHRVANLMYISTTGSLTALFSNGTTATIYGARFHGEISSYDAGSLLLHRIMEAGI